MLDSLTTHGGIMPMQSFTFGLTPEHIIREAFARETPDGYRIRAQGIDAVTLETVSREPSAVWDADALVSVLADLADFPEDGGARWGDYGHYSASEIIDNAFGLRTSILETLGIEEI
jgi:hypothetical protein